MDPQSEKFLAEIQDGDADVRYKAWIRAGDMDPEVIPELGKLLSTGAPGVRRAAEEALKCVVHAVGKDPASPKRAAVVKQLTDVALHGVPTWTQAIALRHLSLIGDDQAVPAVGKLLRHVDLFEEAVFCLERIPGKAATDVLVAALDEKGIPTTRVLAALGHRRVEEATEGCARALTNNSPFIAIAGMKALARIGKQPSKGFTPPDTTNFLPWHHVEFDDSLLRYADEQVRRGDTADAMKYYKQMLDRPEEHLQCAAIIGLSKTNSAAAADLIAGKLGSDKNTVRITAAKATAAMTKKG